MSNVHVGLSVDVSLCWIVVRCGKGWGWGEFIRVHGCPIVHRSVEVSIDAVFEGVCLQVDGLVRQWVGRANLRVGIFIEY